MGHVAAVTGGAAAGQMVTFAFSPLITRIYSPEVFGLQGVFVAMVSFLAPIAAFRYPMAIVVANSNSEVRGLIRLSLLFAIAFSLLLSVFLILFYKPVSEILGIEGIGFLIFFLPLALFFVVLQDVMAFCAARHGAFGLLAGVTIVQALLFNLARTLGGLINPVAAVLVAVSALSHGLNALLTWLGLRRRPIRRESETAVALAPLAKQYREFPLFRLPADLINALTQTAPVFALSLLFSPAAAGFYVLARSVVNLPLALLGDAVGNVFYSRLAELAREGRPLFPFAVRATLFQLVVPGGGLILCAMVFPILFGLVFGEKWRAAGEHAQWMSLWIVGMLVVVPSMRALPVIRRQGLHLLFNSLIAAGGVFSLWAGYRLLGSEHGAIALYSVVSASLYGLQTLIYLREVRAFDRRQPRA